MGATAVVTVAWVSRLVDRLAGGTLPLNHPRRSKVRGLGSPHRGSATVDAESERLRPWLRFGNSAPWCDGRREDRSASSLSICEDSDLKLARRRRSFNASQCRVACRKNRAFGDCAFFFPPENSRIHCEFSARSTRIASKFRPTSLRKHVDVQELLN